MCNFSFHCNFRVFTDISQTFSPALHSTTEFFFSSNRFIEHAVSTRELGPSHIIRARKIARHPACICDQKSRSASEKILGDWKLPFSGWRLKLSSKRTAPRPKVIAGTGCVAVFVGGRCKAVGREGPSIVFASTAAGRFLSCYMDSVTGRACTKRGVNLPAATTPGSRYLPPASPFETIRSSGAEEQS